jgi:hypothetical protein
VNRGTTDLGDLARQLEGDGRSACVRVMCLAGEDGWELRYAWALVGREPAGWRHETWRYEEILFVACTVPARDLAVLAAPGPSAVLTLADVRAVVPAALGPANWIRRPSFSGQDRLLLPWPTTEYTITAGRDWQLPRDALVGRSCPTFPDANIAWRAFFEGDFTLNASNRTPPQCLAVVRTVEDVGWLGHVRVGPTELTAEICGTLAEGAEPELFGQTGRTARIVDGPGTVVLPLEGGLPADAWLWLKAGTQWLDYRVIDPHSGWAGQADPVGIEFDMPAEPQANVQALLAAGESPTVEFKRQLPETAAQKRHVFKSVAAFSTQEGGTIAFGIDPDEMTINGLAGDPLKLRDHLYDLIHQVVIPAPDVTVEIHDIDGNTVLLLHVQSGTVPPYGLAVDKGSRDKPEFYVRRGSSTYPAQPAELRESVQSRPAADTYAPGTPFGPW